MLPPLLRIPNTTWPPPRCTRCAVAGSVPLPQLMQDAMSLAASKGYDVFNALDLMENATFLKDLKFGIGDGTLQYYLYNWRMRNPPVEAGETGLILL